MQIFVPRYRHNMPHIHRDVLIAMLAEIEASDLPRVIGHWQSFEEPSEPLTQDKIEALFKKSLKNVCEHAPKKHTLEPFLRRPNIAIHGGSQGGTEDCKDALREIALDAGRLAAKFGFNLWYGGGDTGMMGTFAEGFREARAIQPARDDHYLIQVMPAPFVLGVKSVNGMRPLNEGLSPNADAAIVMPDFVTRRELLDSRCVAALSCPGGSGTMDEILDILTHIKTGLRSIELYVINPVIDGENYWHHLRRQMQNGVQRGLEKPQTLDYVHFRENAELAFDDLMAKLGNRSATPDQVYAAYCEKYAVRPGVPKAKSVAATPA